MSAETAQLLAAFETLPATEKQVFVRELFRRLPPYDSGPLDDATVALDDRPLGTSKRMLLQVMSEEQNSGWKMVPQGSVNLIESIGRNPWRVRKIAGTVRLARPDASRLKITALDASGAPVEALEAAGGTLALRPQTLYYLITSVN